MNAPGLAPQAATDIADKVVKRRLENVPGVGAVNLVGEATREIQVVVDRARLEAYHVSLADVVNALRNENVDAPAGSADRGATEALVRVAARGRGAARDRAHPGQAGRRDARLRARRGPGRGRRRGAEERWRCWTRSPRSPSTCRSSRAPTRWRWRTGCSAAVEQLARELPPGVTLQIVRDDSTFIRDSIHDVNTTMIIGGILTVLIVFLFLNSWRSTVITGLTLPISVIAAFIAMRVFGFTLNVLTLMGLSLAIGMLIDDAIVVRENIVRHLQRGKDHVRPRATARRRSASPSWPPPSRSSRSSSPWPSWAAWSASSSTSSASRWRRRCWSRCSSASRSTRCCRRAGSTRTSSEHGHEGSSARRLAALQPLVRRAARALRAAARLVAAAPLGVSWSWPLVAFLASFPILAILGGDFMPDFNRGEYQVAFQATPGATLRETAERAREMVRRLKSLPDVEYTYTTIGEAGTQYRPVTEGVTYVKLQSRDTRQDLQRGAGRGAHA